MATYRKIRKIGSGGYGTVHRAMRVEDNATAAMKVLNEPENAEDVARFEKEVRFQRSLNHPNIVHIIGRNLGVTPPWFVMELADDNLKGVLEDVTGNEARVINIFRQILAGMSHAHQNGVIHRDLKPENILIFRNEHELSVKISDFGIARFDPRDTVTLTGTSDILGTLQYSAPEQFTSAREADQRSDIFSLGKILCEMLTGEIPLSLDYIDILDDKYQYIVQKCIETDPGQRFQSVEDLRQQFELAVRPTELLEAPSEEMRGILDSYITADSNRKVELVAELARIFETNRLDDELYRTMIPRLHAEIVSVLVDQHPASFKQIIQTFDEHVSGSLVFSYTDMVADFYQIAFRHTNSLSIKRIILTRLLQMGVSHNRWHVMDVTTELFGSIQHVSGAQVASEVLQSNPYYAGELRTRLMRGPLHRIVRSALDELSDNME